MARDDGNTKMAASYNDVNLKRGDVQALDSVTISMPRGQTTAVLGASGSGKSTLVQLAIGLLRPDSGAVEVLGEPIDYDNLRPLRRRIGYAIQAIALLPHLRIRDNIVLPAVLSRWPEDQTNARLDELVRMMDLHAHVLGRYPHELSGGQQQRAGICRAMILKPELLLLDEPFSGLDALTRESIHDRFLALQVTEAVSTILVTHEPQEAINLASYLVIMREGGVLQQGTVADVTGNPANDYVRKLCTGLRKTSLNA